MMMIARWIKWAWAFLGRNLIKNGLRKDAEKNWYLVKGSVVVLVEFCEGTCRQGTSCF